MDLARQDVLEINDLLSNLGSTKKKERVMSLELIPTFVKQDSIVAYLQACSVDTQAGRGVSWDTLFLKVHCAIVSEVENAPKGITSKVLLTMREAVVSLVEQSRGYISSKSLVSSILDVLNATKLRQVLGKIYVELTSTYLLKSRKYCSELKPENWIDLVDLCKQFYRYPPFDERGFQFLELLNKVVSMGVNCSVPLTILRSLLPFLKDILLSQRQHSTVYWTLLELVNETLEAVVADSRQLAIEFTESVTSAVARMYQSGREYNHLIFKFFSFALCVHHPRGVQSDNNVQCDWNLWMSRVKEMQCVCEKEVQVVVLSGANTNGDYSNFIRVLCDIYAIIRRPDFSPQSTPPCEDRTPFQPISGTLKRKSCDLMVTQTQKRAKMLSLDDDIISILTNLNPQHSWLWLRFLSVLLERHPKSVADEVDQLIGLIINMITEARIKESHVYVYRCACLLMKLDKEQPEERRTVSIKLWSKLFDNLVRNINDGSEVTDEILEILSRLIDRGVPINDKTRCQLVKCCLEEGISPEPAVQLSLMLIQKEVQLDCNNTAAERVCKCEEVYRKLAGIEHSDVKNVCEVKTDELRESICDIVVKHCKERCDSYVTKLCQSLPAFETILNSSKFLEIILFLLSSLWEDTRRNALAEMGEDTRRNALTEMARKLFSALTNCHDCLLGSPYFRVDFLSRLYSLDVRPEVHSLIRSADFTNLTFVEKAFNAAFVSDGLLKLNSKNDNVIGKKRDNLYTSVYSEALQKLFPRGSSGALGPEMFVEKKQWAFLIDIVEFICQYVSSPSPLNRFQTGLCEKIIDTISALEMSSDKPSLQMVLRSVHILGACGQLMPEDVGNCLRLLLKIYKGKSTDFEVLSIAVVILKDLVPGVVNHNGEDTREIITTLMEAFRLTLEKHNYRPREMSVAFVDVLVKILPLDPTGSWAVWKRDGQPMSTLLARFLSDASVEVRLVAARGVGELLKLFDERRQSYLLEDLRESLLSDSFDTDEYDKWCYHSTSVLALSYAFSYSTSARLNAAVLFLDLIKLQSYDTSMVERFLIEVSAQLAVKDVSLYFVRHLKFLLRRWAIKEYKLDEFPFQILKCGSLEEFYLRFSDIIGAEMVLSSSVSEVKHLASKLSCSKEEIAQKIFPVLLPDFLDSRNNLISKENYLWTSLSGCRNNILSFPFIPYGLHQTIREAKSKEHFNSLISALENYIGKDDFMTDLIVAYPNAIPKILLCLEEDIFTAITAEDYESGLNKYIWFTKCYMDEAILDETSTNSYVLRDANSVMTKAIRRGLLSQQVETACDFLQNLILSFLPCFESEICSFLPEIIGFLVQYCPKQTPHILQFLEFLIGNEKTKATVATLTLPDEPEYALLDIQRVKLSLREELTAFSSRRRCMQVGGLVRLRQTLAYNRLELVELYHDLQSSPKTSRNSSNLLHQVIGQLVQLTSHADVKIRREAGKCLGELGPADLTTLVLNPVDSDECCFDCPIERLKDFSGRTLGQLLYHESIYVKKAVCNALFALFTCDEGLSQCTPFLMTFLCNDMKELYLSCKTASGPGVDVWVPRNKVSHEQWLVNLTCGLLDTLTDSVELSVFLADVCRVHPPFAEEILPLLLDVIISESKELAADVGRNISAFFKAHILDKNALHIRSVQCMVHVVDYIRCWRYRSGDHSAFVDVDYLLIAEAASDCANYFTSLLFGELWFEDLKSRVKPLSIDHLGPRGATLSRIMQQAYVNIGIKDGLQGCGSSYLSNLEGHLEDLNRWDLCLLMYDNACNVPGVTRALHNMGLNQTLRCQTADLNIQLDCAARLGDWNCLIPSDAPPSFQLYHYSALKAYHHDDMSAFRVELESALDCVVSDISQIKLESTKALYDPLSQLQQLKELQDFAHLYHAGDFDVIKKKWTEEDMKSVGFKYFERAMSSRCIVLKEKAKPGSNLVDLLAECYLNVSKVARSEKRFDVALKHVSYLNRLCGAATDLQHEGRIEHAQVLWSIGERKVGLALLSNLLRSLTASSNPKILAKGLRIYGDWQVEAKAESPRQIIDEYFLRVLSLTEEQDDRQDSYASIAKFADANYSPLQEYLDSPQFCMRQGNVAQQQCLAKGLAKDMKKRGEDRETKIALDLVTRQTNIDYKEMVTIKDECSYFLTLAIKYYLLGLQAGDKYDFLVFRLTSLWLKNMDNAAVTQLLNEQLPRVPSRKFLCLLPQIAPRMADRIDNPLIEELVERSLVDHPHHTMPVLFALKNSLADQKDKDPVPTPRMIKADRILQRALNNPKLSRAVKQMAMFTEAVIQFANFTLEKSKRGEGIIPKNLAICKLSDLDSVLLPSVNLEVSQSCTYNEIVGVRRFQPDFQLVGGVNAPKKVSCLGTDGKARALLIKGSDDPRQDAVMQQVFGIINCLLARNSETARRKLKIRTYLVQPLSQRSGIIEWCENTQCIGVYLVGQNACTGAHARYHPNDLKGQECRRYMSAVAQSDFDTKLETFQKICESFHPALHFFFLENFPTAGAWFERRLAFTRSVATSSMIGYILGLGDRHLMNILIDNVTAEAIHIDLGIAFDQGKVLRTPETVPFRLTRDIVDAMGCSGVEGVFRTSCEKTMTVLRANHDIILTLLGVLLYDPLYAWTITPEKAMSMQDYTSEGQNSSLFSDDDSSEINTHAERALIRLKTKLQGMEQGVVSSVEGQVAGLIQQAMDPRNLCKLFPGWQPYL